MIRIAELKKFFVVARDPEEDNGYILICRQSQAVTRIDTIVVGSKDHETLVITRIQTEPAERRCEGFGSAALDHLLCHLDNCGHKKTLAAHTVAKSIPFWERRGFQPISPGANCYVRHNPKNLAA